MLTYVDPWQRTDSLQPFLCSHARLYGFVLRGDGKKLDDLAARYLRNPTGRSVDYSAMRQTPFVFVTFGHIGRVQPINPDCAALGWLDQMEVAFWVPMAFTRPNAAAPERFPLLLPYIFVDRSMALLQGREIYGFAKQMASFETTDRLVAKPHPHDLPATSFEDEAGGGLPSSSAARERLVRTFRRNDFEPGGVRVHAFGVQKFGYDRQWRSYPLIELLAPGSCSGLQIHSEWKSHDDLSREMRLPLITGGIDNIAATAFAATNKVFPFEARAVFLKQSHGAAFSGLADYQAIVEAPFRIESFERGGTLKGQYRLRLADSQTHPIIADLGLVPENPEQPEIFKPEVAWWADLSFSLHPGETIWTRQTSSSVAVAANLEKKKKKKIAILGGGIGAISTAFWLTHPGNPAATDIEVTVYQLGWRLGGKCASGRNTERHNRIEERGMHALFGYYYNTLRMMRECLRELAGSERGGHELFHDNFEAHNQAVVGDWFDGRWRAIKMPFPPRRKNERELDAGEYVRLLCKWVAEAVEAIPLIGKFWIPPRPKGRADRAVDTIANFCDRITLLLGIAHSMRSRASTSDEILDVVARATTEPEETWLTSLLHTSSVLRLLDRSGGFVFGERNGLVRTILERMRKRTWSAIKDRMDRNPDTRALWIALDLAFATLRGIFTDDVLLTGYDALDDITFCSWLAKHGAAAETVHSPFVRSLGGSGFAFPDGNTSIADSAAGMVLRNTLRMLFGYRGAFMWKMRAGMGDVIFGNLYEVLKKRGVKFEFFHRVRHLETSEDGSEITRIHIGRQVRLKNDTYDPLIDVKHRKCWPHRPLYDQMNSADAAALRDLQDLPEYRHVPLLESWWGPWDSSRETPVVLEHGKDFDQIVLGISLGALPYICGGLAQRSERWREMFDHVKTVRTQAFQLWMSEEVNNLTSETDGKLKKTIATAYAPPIDSWSDFVQTAAAEDWPPERQPRLIGYFCGVMADDSDMPSDFSDTKYAPAQVQKVYWMMERVVSEQIRDYWPKAYDAQGFRHDLLLTPVGSAAQGKDRLKEQYWTANFEPHDRYVLSVAGSLRYRLRPDAGQAPGASGFNNLYLAGDWTRTGLNAGFVESAVVSGMQASRASTAWPRTIEAENDLRPGK